jgi:hypothetical protein
MDAYAGIGSRATPPEISYWMNEIGAYMASKNWILRSGGATGADYEFEIGCGDGAKEIYLPWPGFNNNNSLLWPFGEHCSNSAIGIAEKVWNDRFVNNMVPIVWEKLKERTKKFMIRNVYQILGCQLNDPVKLVICWTRDGEASGGTGQALWLAKMVNESSKIDHHIAILNLRKETHREALRAVMQNDQDPIIFWKSM